MINKKVHYIWFGNNKSNLVNICILSWKDKLKDYEIIEWNETNLNIEEDIKNNSFLEECYKRKLWAFIADYYRFKILYEYGGIYLDTDIYTLKNFDDLLDCDFFIGKENEHIISAGIIGCVKGHNYIKKILNYYENEINSDDNYIVTHILTKFIDILNTSPNSKIFDREYFYPYYFNEIFEESCITKNTYTIHWWAKSWGGSAKNFVYLQTKHVNNHVLRQLIKIKKYLAYFFYTYIKKT